MKKEDKARAMKAFANLASAYLEVISLWDMDYEAMQTAFYEVDYECPEVTEWATTSLDEIPITSWAAEMSAVIANMEED